MTMTIPEAIEVFVRAFCLGKSATYPYVAENLLAEEQPSHSRALWTMQDAPGRKRDRRKAEVISFGLGPEETLERVRQAELGWHFLCAIHWPEDDFDAVRQAFKALGYRALSTEWLFVHDLHAIPEVPCDLPVVSVLTKDEANAFNRAAMQQMFRPRDFAEPPLPFRQYGIRANDRFVGRVRSVPVGENAWVSDLHVAKAERGKGYGKALMAHLLREDKAYGVRHSVLLASTDGARIYPKVGYRQIGVLQVFCPVRRE